MHGANSRRGPDHPRFTTGRFTRSLPADLRRIAAAVRQSPDQQRPDEDVVLMEALKLLRLKRAKDEGRTLDAADEAALAMLTQAKLGAIDRCLKVQQLSAEHITRLEFFGFVRAMSDAVERHVSDPAIRYALRQDVRAQLLRSGFITRLGDGVIDEIRKANGGTATTNE